CSNALMVCYLLHFFLLSFFLCHFNTCHLYQLFYALLVKGSDSEVIMIVLSVMCQNLFTLPSFKKEKQGAHYCLSSRKLITGIDQGEDYDSHNDLHVFLGEKVEGERKCYFFIMKKIMGLSH